MKLFMIIPILLLFELHYGNSFQNIPEAPRLPDLDYNSLPEFVRKYLPAQQPKNRSPNEFTEAKKGIARNGPRTYGMNINNDHGVVWNDMATPNSRYQVGNSKNFVPDQEIDDIIDDFINQINIHTTPKPDEDLYKRVYPTTTEPPKTTRLTEPTTIEETSSIYTTEETKTTRKESVNTTPKPKEASKKTEKELLKEIENKLDGIIKDVSQYIKIPHNNANESVEDSKVTPSEKSSQDKGKNDKDVGDNTGKYVVKNNQDSKANEQKSNNVPSILELIVRDDELWSWLNNNVAKYLEIFMDRISAAVQEEVETLLQSYFETHQCGVCENKNTTIDDVNSAKPIIDDKNEENESSVDNDKETASKDPVEDLSKKRKEKPEADKVDKKPETENKSDKTTIYGNSVGNERVTNVFIFHMNTENNGKPTISSNNSSGSYTIDLDKNPPSVDEDNKSEVKDTTEKEQGTTESTKQEENDKETNDSERTKVSTKEKKSDQETKDSKGKTASTKKKENDKKTKDSEGTTENTKQKDTEETTEVVTDISKEDSEKETTKEDSSLENTTEESTDASEDNESSTDKADEDDNGINSTETSKEAETASDKPENSSTEDNEVEE